MRPNWIQQRSLHVLLLFSGVEAILFRVGGRSGSLAAWMCIPLCGIWLIYAIGAQGRLDELKTQLEALRLTKTEVVNEPGSLSVKADHLADDPVPRVDEEGELHQTEILRPFERASFRVLLTLALLPVTLALAAGRTLPLLGYVIEAVFAFRTYRAWNNIRHERAAREAALRVRLQRREEILQWNEVLGLARKSRAAGAPTKGGLEQFGQLVRKLEKHEQMNFYGTLRFTPDHPFWQDDAKQDWDLAWARLIADPTSLRTIRDEWFSQSRLLHEQWFQNLPHDDPTTYMAIQQLRHQRALLEEARHQTELAARSMAAQEAAAAAQQEAARNAASASDAARRTAAATERLQSIAEAEMRNHRHTW